MKLDCGHDPSPHTESSNGYGTDSKGNTFCYECCAKQDIEHMQKNGRIALYLVKKDNGYEVTNWPSSLKFKAFVRVGNHNICKNRYDAWFWMDNVQWHGVTYGDFTQICHCRKTKVLGKQEC